MAYWLLTTHGVALFPIGVFIWTWKRRKDAAANIYVYKIFILCNLFTIIPLTS